MRFRPETTAWLTMLISFGVFCLLCASAALGTNWYLRSATDKRTAIVSTIEGTVTVSTNNGETFWALQDPEDQLEEGVIIRTDKNSRALVTLFDNSTVEVFRDSEIRLSKLRVSRFDLLAPRKNFISLEQTKGKARLGVARPPIVKTEFTVNVPQATMVFDEGSYIVAADSQLSSLRVRDRGTARVLAMDIERVLKEQQRVEIPAGHPPSELLPAAQELIQNGDFQDGFKGWTVDPERNSGYQLGQDVAGTISLQETESLPAVHFSRAGSTGTHAEPTISQQINRDLSEFSVVRLSIRLKLLYQSLGGGGYLGSEYPLLVKLIYSVEGGSETFYVKGFYYQNEQNNRTDNGIQVPPNAWVDLTINENLFVIQPSPRVLKSIEITASGWDFDSMLAKISLVAE